LPGTKSVSNYVPPSLPGTKSVSNYVPPSLPGTKSVLNYVPPSLPGTKSVSNYVPPSLPGMNSVSNYVPPSLPSVSNYVPPSLPGIKSVLNYVPSSLPGTKSVSNYVPPPLPGIPSVSSAMTALMATPPTTTLSMVTRTMPTWSDRHKIHQGPNENCVHNLGQSYFNKDNDQTYHSDQWQMLFSANQMNCMEKRLSPPLVLGASLSKSPNCDKFQEVTNGRVTPPTDNSEKDFRSSLSPLFGHKQVDMAIVDSVLYNMARNSNQSQTVGSFPYPVVCTSAGIGAKMSTPCPSMVYGTGKVTGPGSCQGDIIGPHNNGPVQLNSRISPKQNLVNSRYGAMLHLSQLSDMQNITPPKLGNTSLNTSDISIPADYENVEIRLLSSPDNLLGTLNLSTSSNQVASTNETQPERPRTSSNQVTSTNEMQPERPRKRRRSSSSSRDQSKPKNRPLPQHAVDIMLEWYEKHLDDPYPSRKDIQEIADAGEIAYSQARSWFANKRNRSKNTRITNYRKKFKNELSSICHDWMKQEASGKPDTQKVVDRIIGLIAENSGKKKQKNSLTELPITV
jgi:hypothetical protein